MGTILTALTVSIMGLGYWMWRLRCDLAEERDRRKHFDEMLGAALNKTDIRVVALESIPQKSLTKVPSRFDNPRVTRASSWAQVRHEVDQHLAEEQRQTELKELNTDA